LAAVHAPELPAVVGAAAAEDLAVVDASTDVVDAFVVLLVAGLTADVGAVPWTHCQ